MLGLIQPLSLIVGSWALLFLVFSGLGMAALRVAGQRVSSGGRWLDSFWVGWVLSLLILQIWHIAFPVNDAALLILAGCASASIVLSRSQLAPILRGLRNDKVFALLFGILLLWFASRAIEMPTAFDTGYRDIQAVLWTSAYAIVPGLGNLFASLAYNHPTYLYNALLDFGPFAGKSYAISTGLLLLAYLAGALRGSLQLWRGRNGGDFRWSALFAMLTIPYALHYTVGRGGVTHYLTDTVVDLLGFLTLIALLDFAQYWRSGAQKGYLIWRLAALVAVGIIVKHSYVVFGLSCAGLALAIWLRRGGMDAGRRATLTLAAKLIALFAAFLLPWMARGVITSGYVAYPLSVGRVELDWAMPAVQIEARQKALATNTRAYGGESDDVLGSWSWLGAWLARLADNAFHALLPTGIAALALALAALSRRSERGGRKSALGWWILAPPAVMLVFWFVSFPNPKYARYLFWSVAALCMLLATLEWGHAAQGMRILCALMVMALCMLYVVYAVARLGNFPLPPGPDDGFYLREQPPFFVFETDSGLTVHITGHPRQCWDIPLPCTRTPDSRLMLRAPGDLAAGFSVSNAGD